MQAYGQSKLATLMFAREFDRRSREAGWGVMSNAAHPGLTKTNLQISGPSHGQDKPSVVKRLYTSSWRFLPFMWQEIDDGNRRGRCTRPHRRPPKAERSTGPAASTSWRAAA